MKKRLKKTKKHDIISIKRVARELTKDKDLGTKVIKSKKDYSRKGKSKWTP